VDDAGATVDSLVQVYEEQLTLGDLLSHRVVPSLSYKKSAIIETLEGSSRAERLRAHSSHTFKISKRLLMYSHGPLSNRAEELQTLPNPLQELCPRSK
jgi:hypothetical protein